jgi:hypothetical protein
MSHLYASLEPLIVALIVLLCALAVVRSQAPRLWSRITGRAPRSASCHDSSSGSKADCSSGCGSCSSNTPAQETNGEQRIHFHGQS